MTGCVGVGEKKRRAAHKYYFLFLTEITGRGSPLLPLKLNWTCHSESRPSVMRNLMDRTEGHGLMALIADQRQHLLW
jgi:hypothetical protein